MGNATPAKVALDFIRKLPEGARGGSEAEVTSCSGRGLGINSWHLHGSQQLSIAPVPGDLMPFSDL